VLRCGSSWRIGGNPIEEIIRDVLIPKLRAKKTKFFIIGDKIETRVTDDHNIQLKDRR